MELFSGRKCLWIAFLLTTIAAAERLDSNSLELNVRRIPKPKLPPRTLKTNGKTSDSTNFKLRAPVDEASSKVESTAENTAVKGSDATTGKSNEQQSSKTETGATEATTKIQVKQQIPIVAALCTFCRNSLIKFLDNPLKLGKTVMQLGLLFVLTRILFESFQEALKELKDMKDDSNSSLQPSSFWKPSALGPVLEALKNEQPLPAAADSNLHRIAHRLQVVMRWPIYANNCSQSIESFLLSLTRYEWLILEQCLYLPKLDLNKTLPSLEKSLVDAKHHQQTMWNKIYGLSPHIPQCLHDRLACLRHTRQKNIVDPYATLWQQNSGILLYGPPGNGKTMLLKALKATPFLPCLSLTPSILLDKYVGETNRYVRSLFSLIQKLSSGGTTTLLVIDELDGLFRERRNDEHEHSRQMKTEFLQWWDQCSNNNEVLVVGATNRPYEVDPAVLRRLSQSYLLDRPNPSQRYEILSSVLHTIPHIGFSDETGQALAAMSEGFCSSDLVQWISTAVQQGPYRDGPRGNSYRPLTKNDLLRSPISPTRLSQQYLQALAQFHKGVPCTLSRSSQKPHRSQQQQHQPMMVQNTPWGNFIHAGTHVMDYNQYDDEDETDFCLTDSSYQNEDIGEESEDEENHGDFGESDY